MTSSYLAIDPSNILTSGPITLATGTFTANPVAIQPARGLFMVEITDVAVPSTLRVTITGGLSRDFGNIRGVYVALIASGLNTNVTINDVGTATAGASQTTIVVTDATTATEFTLVYIPTILNSSTNLPTIQHTGGAAPAGNTLVSTTYLNCNPMSPSQL